MTKERPPLSPFSALTQIAGLIGWKQAATIVGRTERAVRNWSEPDTKAGISYAHAIELDVAHRDAGGDGYPLFAVYEAELKERVAAINGGMVRLAECAAKAAAEHGEATAAQMRALSPAASRTDLLIAEKETREDVEAQMQTLHSIEAALGKTGS